MSTNGDRPTQPRRQRLQREQRHRQLLDIAWRLVRDEGSDGLTLGRLAEHARVTKPVVYSHFPTRPALLATLYREHDHRQTRLMAEALAKSAPTLTNRAAVIAGAYVDCVLSQGREIPGINAALSGAPELERIKRDHEAIFMHKCREALAPFTSSKQLSDASLCGMLGAAEALSYAAVADAITAEGAKHELYATIIAMVARS